jgi:DNA repair photolyase
VIGVNTDAYQPIERHYKITRSILEVAAECHHPIGPITKSALIERDRHPGADGEEEPCFGDVTVTTLDHSISMKMEPRTSAPARRLLAIKRLSEVDSRQRQRGAVIPFLDSELESILEAAAAHGAVSAAYTLIRLPWVKPIFKEWLEKTKAEARHVANPRHARWPRKRPQFRHPDEGHRHPRGALSQRFKKAVKRRPRQRDP